MPTFGSETYRSTNPLETIKPRDTHPYFIRPESIAGPDSIAELTRLQPNTAAAGAADFLLTVLGIGFLKHSVIMWNGIPQVTTYTNANTLKATVKSSPAPATYQVMVRNNATLSLARPFTFTASE